MTTRVMKCKRLPVVLFLSADLFLRFCSFGEYLASGTVALLGMEPTQGRNSLPSAIDRIPEEDGQPRTQVQAAKEEGVCLLPLFLPDEDWADWEDYVTGRALAMQNRAAAEKPAQKKRKVGGGGGGSRGHTFSGSSEKVDM